MQTMSYFLCWMLVPRPSLYAQSFIDSNIGQYLQNNKNIIGPMSTSLFKLHYEINEYNLWWLLYEEAKEN